VVLVELPKADVNDIYFNERCMDRNLITELSTGQFIHVIQMLSFKGLLAQEKLSCLCYWKAGMQATNLHKIYLLPDLLVEYDESNLVSKSKSKNHKKYTGYGMLILDEWFLEDISEE